MLPKVKSVIYDVTIPGTDRTVKMRGFTVKDLKVILEAKEFGDDHGFVNTVKSVVSDCLFGEVDVDELPIYAVDYLFLKIKSKSDGEEVPAQYICHNQTPEGVCNAKFNVVINLNDVYVKYPKDYNSKCIIQLTDTIGIRLKSPSFSKFRSVGLEGKGVFDITDDYIFACVDSVFDGDKVLIPGKDFTFQELKEFIESFPANVIPQITEFFKNQPTVSFSLNLVCPKCRASSVIELNGLDDFFE